MGQLKESRRVLQAGIFLQSEKKANLGFFFSKMQLLVPRQLFGGRGGGAGVSGVVAVDSNLPRALAAMYPWGKPS